MNTYDWAKNELNLARENEIAKCKKDPDYEPGDEQYGLMCYDAAEQLISVFEDQGHSGFSSSVVFSIFERLVKGNPLTPITDEDDQWCERYTVKEDPLKRYQHKRMSRLFKRVDADGNVFYRDTNRVVAYDQRGHSYHNGLVEEVIDKYFPIKFPYIGEKIRVRIEDFSDVETPDGYVDVRHIIDAIKDGKEYMPIDRYFMISDDDEDWHEIDVFIYHNIIKNVKEETDNG